MDNSIVVDKGNAGLKFKILYMITYADTFWVFKKFKNVGFVYYKETKSLLICGLTPETTFTCMIDALKHLISNREKFESLCLDKNLIQKAMIVETIVIKLNEAYLGKISLDKFEDISFKITEKKSNFVNKLIITVNPSFILGDASFEEPKMNKNVIEFINNIKKREKDLSFHMTCGFFDDNTKYHAYCDIYTDNYNRPAIILRIVNTKLEQKFFSKDCNYCEDIVTYSEFINKINIFVEEIRLLNVDCYYAVVDFKQISLTIVNK
jgi:hypothetical protein